MKYFSFLFFIFSCVLTNSQNLIHNATFEDNLASDPNAPCKQGQAALMQVWEDEHFFPGICTYLKCDGSANCDCFPCNFSYFHSPDWYRNTTSFHNLVETETILYPTLITKPYNFINGHNNNSFIGMRTKEIIEQPFFNSSPIVGGRTYVFSAYVRIPRPSDSNFPNAKLSEARRAYGCSGLTGSRNVIAIDFAESSNIALNVLLATQKIRYSDLNTLTCNSAETGDTKDISNNHIVKLNTFNLNINNYSLYQWHRVTFEFVCPANYNYDWIGLELDDVQTEDGGYLLIDDLSIIEKCELGCTKTSGLPNPIITPQDPNVPGCMGAVISNLSNVETVHIEVFDLSAQLIKNILFQNSNGFGNTPLYWYGDNQGGAPVAAGLYIVKVTCTNDCPDPFVFTQQVLFGGDCGYQYFQNPPYTVIEPKISNDCCEIDLNFTGKTFDNFGLVTHSYYYKPRNDINITDCSFTYISNSTFKAGHEIKITGETSILPGSTPYQTGYPIPEFHALIEQCPDANRLIGEQPLTDKDFTFYGPDSELSVGGLSRKDKPSTVMISPNPSMGEYTIESIDNSIIEKISVRSLIGNVVAEFNKTNKIDIKFLSKGIYMSEITVGEEKIVKKLILE